MDALNRGRASRVIEVTVGRNLQHPRQQREDGNADQPMSRSAVEPVHMRGQVRHANAAECASAQNITDPTPTYGQSGGGVSKSAACPIPHGDPP